MGDARPQCEAEFMITTGTCWFRCTKPDYHKGSHTATVPVAASRLDSDVSTDTYAIVVW